MSRPMNWRDAYEERITLWRFWHSMAGRQMAQGFVQDAIAKGRTGEASAYGGMKELECHKLAYAEPIFVDADMVDLIEAASEGFSPEPLEETDLIAPYGFVLFEKPIVIKDVHDKVVSVRAMTWGVATHFDPTGPPGVAFAYYSHKHDPDGYGWAELMEQDTEGILSRWPLTPTHMTSWQFGDAYDEAAVGAGGGARDALESGQITQENLAKSYSAIWKLTQVTLKLMNQRIATVESRTVDRHARKRAKREKLDEDKVTVVTLRRLRSEGAAQTGSVEWTHRWIVHGFWRNQWYPKSQTHRQIWINDYVKGPDDLELRISPRAYKLVR